MAAEEGNVRVLRVSGWEAGLVVKKNGAPANTPGNAALMLCHSTDWGIRWDELSGSAVIDKAPELHGIKAPKLGRFDAYHEAAVRHWLSFRFGGHSFGPDVVIAAVEFAAKQRRFSPLREYLEGIRWDGQPRIGTWLRDYLGADVSGTMANVGRLWLISGVARAMEPGCKADHMLVLEGAQGARKTSALEALFGSEWFLDSVPDLTNKDAQVMLAGKWGACMDELHAMRSDKLTELAKNYLTRRSDKYRPPYSRHQIDQPRTVIFCGTTNQEQYLHDPTGSRRFWPCRVGARGPVLVEAISRDRDQLWAEAVVEYRDGKEWWPDESESAAISEANEDRQHHDEWHAAVERYIETKEQVTISGILTAIGLEPKEIDQRAQTRVARVLCALGWERVRSRALDGSRTYVYRKAKRVSFDGDDETSGVGDLF